MGIRVDQGHLSRSVVSSQIEVIIVSLDALFFLKSTVLFCRYQLSTRLTYLTMNHLTCNASYLKPI